jgi:murein DD-endopeptidase MepM/ murein hydrolase activator NlpD
MPFLALVFLLLLAPPGAEAAQVALTSPAGTTCWTGEGAQYALAGGAITPLRGEFSWAPAGAAPLAPRVVSAASGEQGDVIRIYLDGTAALTGVTLELRGSGGRLVTRAAGFRLDRPGREPLWCILFGIPVGAAVGTDELSVTAADGSRRWLLLQDFVVLPHAFLEERFPLSTQLTTLLTAPDPKKTAESNALAKLLDTPHASALYEPGSLDVPLPSARRTSEFGDTRQYLYAGGGSDVSVHYGVDLALPTGTPVPAAGAGRVVFAAARILTGNTVIIEHLPGLFSLYFHMSSLAVKPGQDVTRGAVLGAVGMTGFATGPHLHWEVTVNGLPVDPDRLTGSPLLDTNPAFPDSQILISDEGR